MLGREDVATRLVDVFGKRAQDWLATIPELVAAICAEWSLVLERGVLGNYSFVIPCGEFVLKLLPPSENFDRELAAMLAWDGDGAARIIKHDSVRGAMLIERLRPGTELTTLFHEGNDEEATVIACGIMRRLAIPLPGLGGLAIPTAAARSAELAELRKRFNGKTGPFPAHLVDAAEGFFTDLLASQGPGHLIHADLHHENILSATREPWLAIDPHGLIAEPEFETYAWLNNPDGLSKNPDLTAISRRRIDQISDLTGFDKERIRGWGIACAVLSSWWSFDGHGSANEADLAVADALLSL